MKYLVYVTDDMIISDGMVADEAFLSKDYTTAEVEAGRLHEEVKDYLRQHNADHAIAVPFMTIRENDQVQIFKGDENV